MTPSCQEVPRPDRQIVGNYEQAKVCNIGQVELGLLVEFLPS